MKLLRAVSMLMLIGFRIGLLLASLRRLPWWGFEIVALAGFAVTKNNQRFDFYKMGISGQAAQGGSQSAYDKHYHFADTALASVMGICNARSPEGAPSGVFSHRLFT